VTIIGRRDIVIDRAVAIIDRHGILVGMLICVLPLVFAVWCAGAFGPRDTELPAAEEQAVVNRPHNIFDDMPPQRQALETTEEDCRTLHGIYDGVRCVLPRLAR
jgi:hypothetical protein